MATIEKKGILTYVDEAGNTYLLYPVTTADAVDGLYELLSDVNDEIDKMLPKGGGTVTGNIAMSGKKVTGLGTPTNSGDAANKNYVDGKHAVFTATLTTNDWSGSEAPYTQRIGISGIQATDSPHVSPVYSSVQGTRLAEREAWNMVCDVDTSNGYITFTCFEDKPSIAIPIQIEVNR